VLSGRLRSLSIAAEAVEEPLSFNRLVAMPPAREKTNPIACPALGRSHRSPTRETGSQRDRSLRSRRICVLSLTSPRDTDHRPCCPSLAQQEKTTVDAQTVQQLHAIGSKSDDAFKKGDASARAALFTEDAILLGPKGPIKGRQAIEKYYTELFKNVRFIENTTKYDNDSPHVIGTSGNDVWESGEWSCSIEDQNGVPKQLKGYWCSVKVREGDTWKIRFVKLSDGIGNGGPIGY
jgi:ketosteroid isomerase-like protein